jgi:hypothetical protein
MAKNNKNKKDRVDYLEDVVFAVLQYDNERLIKGSNTENLHKEAVKKIELCNREFGKGYISISKARNLIQIRSKR